MSPSNGHKPHATTNAGFTLLELIVAMSISVVIIMGVFGAYIYLGRNLTRLANSQSVEVAGRRTTYLFIRDVSSASQVVGLGTSSQITLTVPGPLSSTKTVTYSYQSATGSLVRTGSPTYPAGDARYAPEDVSDSADPRAIILGNLTAFSFNYYDLTGGVLPSPASSTRIKAVEFSFTTSTGVAANGTKTAYSAVSPRVLLRNKQLLGTGE